MNKLCIFVGVLLGGIAGGMLSEAFDLGIWWDVVLSGVGSVAGVYAGWKVARRFD